jgi:hypothetical protein
MTEAPVLALPDFEKVFEVTVMHLELALVVFSVRRGVT